jgi:predicted dehydrogenase
VTGRTTYGVGIVGCGMIADFHARAILEVPGARLTAFCSRSEDKARRAGERHGAAWTTDLEAFLARPDVDIVSICSASGAHGEAAMAATAAGKHVIIEKPLEVTLERCLAVVQAARAAGVKLGVVFPSRFHDVSRLVKGAIDQGRLGRLTVGGAYVKWWRTQAYYDDGGWKGSQAMDGGGALMNQSIHAIDLLQWYMGPVESVTGNVATLAHERIEVEDTAVATVQFASGALGVIEGATSAFPGFLKRIEISGDRGSVEMEEENIRTWRFAEERPDDAAILSEYGCRTTTGGGAADPSAISHEGHRRQFVDFIDAVRHDREPFVNGEEGMKSVAIILAIYESARTGRAVRPATWDTAACSR